MDWHSLIFDPSEKVFDTLDKLAIKQFNDEELARESVTAILKDWRDAGWVKLNAYQHRNNASPNTYIYTVFKHALIDEYRKRFGRCDPPPWLKALGAHWSKIYRQLCCQKLTRHHLRQIYHLSVPDDELSSIFTVIEQKDPRCSMRGARVLTVSMHAEDDDDLGIDIADSTDDQKEREAEYENVIDALYLWLGAERRGEKSSSNRLFAALSECDFDDEEIVLLRLIYQQNFGLPDAADFLQMKHHTARRRVRAAIEKIQRIFKTLDIEFDV